VRVLESEREYLYARQKLALVYSLPCSVQTLKAGQENGTYEISHDKKANESLKCRAVVNRHQFQTDFSIVLVVFVLLLLLLYQLCQSGHTQKIRTWWHFCLQHARDARAHMKEDSRMTLKRVP